MKNVSTRQFFGGSSHHFFPTYNAHVVRVLQFFCSRIRIPSVHVVNCPPGQNHIVEGLFEGSGCQVHWANSKQGQSVDSDHDYDEKAIEDHFKEANNKLGVKHKHSFVLPWVLTDEQNENGIL